MPRQPEAPASDRLARVLAAGLVANGARTATPPPPLCVATGHVVAIGAKAGAKEEEKEADPNRCVDSWKACGKATGECCPAFVALVSAFFKALWSFFYEIGLWFGLAFRLVAGCCAQVGKFCSRGGGDSDDEGEGKKNKAGIASGRFAAMETVPFVALHARV